MSSSKKSAGEWAREYAKKGDPKGWSEALYAAASRDAEAVPWADLRVNPGLIEWLDECGISGAGQRALVVGSGLGDDAEELLRRGFDVVGFDLSATAIQWCRERFPDSRAEYRQADLFDLPDEWNGTFDLIFESYTLQVMPEDERAQAMDLIAGLLADDGRLLVICRGRDPGVKLRDLPWPLTRDELRRFEQAGLQEYGFAEYLDHDQNRKTPIRRFRLEYTLRARES